GYPPAGGVATSSASTASSHSLSRASAVPSASSSAAGVRRGPAEEPGRGARRSYRMPNAAARSTAAASSSTRKRCCSRRSPLVRAERPPSFDRGMRSFLKPPPLLYCTQKVAGRSLPPGMIAPEVEVGLFWSGAHEVVDCGGQGSTALGFNQWACPSKKI